MELELGPYDQAVQLINKAKMTGRAVTVVTTQPNSLGVEEPMIVALAPNGLVSSWLLSCALQKILDEEMKLVAKQVQPQGIVLK